MLLVLHQLVLVFNQLLLSVLQSKGRVATIRPHNILSLKKFHMTINSVFDRLGPPKMTRQFFKLKGDHVASKNGWLASSCKKKIITNVFMHYGDIKVRAETIEETMSKEEDEESVASCNHITISNDEPLEEEDAGDELKEINLGISDDPRPIYISALLSSEEEKAYVDLLQEF